jgi:hypothetical protein
VTATWQRKPVRPPERELVTACYLPDLSGQDYRDMHAELSRVARHADPDAATSEALFADGEPAVLLVRYSDNGYTAYVTVEPGNHLGYDMTHHRLTEVTDTELATWWARS